MIAALLTAYPTLHPALRASHCNPYHAPLNPLPHTHIITPTGQLDRLRKMLKIAEMRGDVMGRFHNAMFLGDVHEQVGAAAVSWRFRVQPRGYRMLSRCCPCPGKALR